MKPLLVVLVIAMLVTSCSSAPTPTPQPANANMPNPASANCAEKGGDLDIRKDASGGEVGYCKFPDGSECEEWAFFRNECQPKTPVKPANANMPNPASANCAEKGGDLDIRKDASGGEVGYCKFPDGSECEEWAFFRNECQPKTPVKPANANMPNPASANCAEKGGDLDIRKDASGGEVGYCKFPDGSECEEWAFFRNECQPKTPVKPANANMPNPASANCAEKGGDLDIRKDASGGEVGYCKFPDGSECEEWALMRGECQPKTPVKPIDANMPNPASANCAEKGGDLDIRKDASGGEVGYCKFPDGSECEEWALMRGECQAGAGLMTTPPPQAQP